MRRPALYIALLLVPLIAAQYTCLAATCVSRYDEFPDLLSKEPWGGRIPQPAYSSGNFTCPLPADRNSRHPSNLDYSKNERIVIGDNYTVQWTQNTTKKSSWDLYLVNEQYEKYFLHSTQEISSLRNISQGRYFWLVRENDFVKSGAMYFFYVARSDGFWSEGFASRYVNVSRAAERGLKISKMTSGAIGISMRPYSVIMLVSVCVVISWMVLLL